jgi:hypothetical protein
MKNIIESIDLQYGVNCDYQTEERCAEYGCQEEGICRCTTIHNEEVSYVNIPYISNRIYETIYGTDKATKRDEIIKEILFGFNKEFEVYCFDRILRSKKIWKSNNWIINVVSGYYGQEIGDVKLYHSLAKDIDVTINEFINIENIKDRIEKILTLEYGYILPELKECEYEVITLNVEDLVFPQNNHYQLVKYKAVSFYSDENYLGIRGIVKRSGDKYKVIDGYHRLSKTKKNEVKVILAK